MDNLIQPPLKKGIHNLLFTKSPLIHIGIESKVIKESAVIPIFTKKINARIFFPKYVHENKIYKVSLASTVQPSIPKTNWNQSLVGAIFDHQ